MDARRFISLVCHTELGKLEEGEISLEQFKYLIEALERQSFLSNHHKFYLMMRELAEKVLKNKGN